MPETVDGPRNGSDIQRYPNFEMIGGAEEFDLVFGTYPFLLFNDLG